MKRALLLSTAPPDGSAQRLHVLVVGSFITVLVGLTVASAGPASAKPDGPGALRPTRTRVGCKPDALPVNSEAACTATVTDTATGKKIPPAGAVGFTSDGSGSFDITSCTLAGTGASASCGATYTPGRIGTGIHVITASYAGSEAHNASSGKVDLSITPPNDNRRTAARVRAPPTAVDGTTAGATTDFSDPEPRCAEAEGTVWYGYSSRVRERIAVRLKAHGNLDAVVAVYQRVRSQFKQLGCVPTDAKGIAGVAFEAVKRGRYLILVGQRENSAASTFRLELFAPPLAKPPGTFLADRGVRSVVDPLTKPEQAWSVVLAAGRTYRINLAPDRGRCLPLSLFAAKTQSFTATEPIRYAGCGGYLVFTPGPDGGGRYSLLVQAQGSRGGLQRYRLRVARAGIDDTAPGLLIRSGQTRRGALSGRGIDVVDLYRFDVTHRTDVSASLHIAKGTRFDLLLVSAGGHRIMCACGRGDRGKLRTQLDSGEYFLAVRARAQSGGSYAASLLIREITSTTALISGALRTMAAARQAVTLTAQVTPGAAIGGRVRLQLDRFDPIEGWQFFRLLFARIGSGGTAGVTWVPPSVGRWRLHAVFLGTRAASPSESAYAQLLVEASAK